MSLIKIADSCASSSTNRITPSPECRASQSLYETIVVSLFARLPSRALLAALLLARDSCSASFSPRIFEQKRDCSQSKGQLPLIRSISSPEPFSHGQPPFPGVPLDKGNEGSGENTLTCEI